MLLQLVQTRSPIWLEVKDLPHIRQARSLRIGGWSGSGFLLLLLDDIHSLPGTVSLKHMTIMNSLLMRRSRKMDKRHTPRFITVTQVETQAYSKGLNFART